MSQVMFNQSILVLILEILLLGEFPRALIGCGAGERPWEPRQRPSNDSFFAALSLVKNDTPTNSS